MSRAFVNEDNAAAQADLGGARRAEKAPDQGDHFAHRSATAPQVGPAPGNLEGIDEQQRLAGLGPLERITGYTAAHVEAGPLHRGRGLLRGAFDRPVLHLEDRVIRRARDPGSRPPMPEEKEPPAMDWRHRSACLDEDPELFFPIGNTGPAILQIEEAKQVCRRCEVREQCLAWALEAGQDHGVWGGLSEDERRALKRRNARARVRTA